MPPTSACRAVSTPPAAPRPGSKDSSLKSNWSYTMNKSGGCANTSQLPLRSPSMNTPTDAKPRFPGWHALSAGVGVFSGIGVTASRPMIGLMLGVAALVAAAVLFLIKRVPRWAVWLVAGLAIGVAGYYLLALLSMLNPTPASNSGGS